MLLPSSIGAPGILQRQFPLDARKISFSRHLCHAGSFINGVHSSRCMVSGSSADGTLNEVVSMSA